MGDTILNRIWRERWRIASILIPVLVLDLFANFAILPMIQKMRMLHQEKLVLQENIYTPAWLDSTEANLKTEVELLKQFQNSKEFALSKDSSIQNTVDRIRSTAQKSGIEIIKTTPTIGKADSLRQIRIKLEGYTRYPNLLQFFDELKSNHPDMFLEEMNLRSNNFKGSGKLETHLILSVYDRKLGQIL